MTPLGSPPPRTTAASDKSATPTPGALEAPIGREAQFRRLLQATTPQYIMEAHNALSAKIVEVTGFRAIWASGFSIAAALGVRDSNEVSWTQVLDVAEYMVDATTIPVMLDGDSGFGNFNSVRRLVRKVCQRGVAAICIEDKLFPKTNSFIGHSHELTSVAEFCGKIRAGKDSQCSPDFTLVARTEALIAGRGMNDALDRAAAYEEAGADAIFIHSKASTGAEVLEFARRWTGRIPLVVAPTSYHTTPYASFRDAGIRIVICANQNLRASVRAMQQVSAEIFRERSLVQAEDVIARMSDVFELVDQAELTRAEARYLPAVPDDE